MAMKATPDDILPRKPISLVAMDSFAAFRGGALCVKWCTGTPNKACISAARNHA